MKDRANEEILENMKNVRRLCTMGGRLRSLLNIPRSYPLKEVQFKGVFLWKEEYELIGQELNCDYVNPFFCSDGNEKWSKVIEEGELAVRLDTRKSEEQEERYENRKAHRKLMQERKEKGVWV